MRHWRHAETQADCQTRRPRNPARPESENTRTYQLLFPAVVFSASWVCGGFGEEKVRVILPDHLFGDNNIDSFNYLIIFAAVKCYL